MIELSILSACKAPRSSVLSGGRGQGCREGDLSPGEVACLDSMSSQGVQMMNKWHRVSHGGLFFMFAVMLVWGPVSSSAQEVTPPHVFARVQT